MQIDILQMPAEGVWRVRVDEQHIPGKIRKNPRNPDRWQVVFKKDGKDDQLRTEPHSREGAACLLLFHHFEQERKLIRETEDKRQRAEQARQSAAETASEETDGSS